jgi:hypothetical protein
MGREGPTKAVSGADKLLAGVKPSRFVAAQGIRSGSACGAASEIFGERERIKRRYIESPAGHRRGEMGGIAHHAHTPAGKPPWHVFAYRRADDGTPAETVEDGLSPRVRPDCPSLSREFPERSVRYVRAA